MDITSQVREQIVAEAVEWFLHFQNSDLGSKDYQALSEWLTRSPVHVEEYLAVSAAWKGISVPDIGDFSSDTLIAAARTSELANDATKVHYLETHVARCHEFFGEALPTQRRRWHWIGIAASLIVSCGVWLGYQQWERSNEFVTAIGEQRSVTLADGSVVILNTDSKVRVEWNKTERLIELVRGEGQFHVAKNPDRPFLVSTNYATVKAIGTVFNVRKERAGTQVVVLEGRVKLTAATSAATLAQTRGKNQRAAERPTDTGVSFELAAGRRAAVTSHGIDPDIGPSVESVAAWTQRRLIFRDQRLEDVVSEFNRYRTQPMVVDDGQLANLRISGVFELGDADSLLVYLKSFETVDIVRSRDGSVHLSRAASSEVQK